MSYTSSLDPDGSAADWFCELMKDLAASYPNFRASERQTRVYATALQDLTPDQVRNAMGRAILESKFFPSVAELRQYVDASPDDRAQRAWLLLRRAVEEVGRWRSIVIEDACAADALRRVARTWPEFCEIDDGPTLMVMRQGFLSSYRDARRTVARHALPVRLAGLCESSASSVLETPELVARLTSDGAIAISQQAIGSRETKQLPSGGNEV